MDRRFGFFVIIASSLFVFAPVLGFCFDPSQLSTSNAGSVMPWSSGLAAIAQAISGPLVKIVGVIMIAAGAITVMILEGGGLKKVAWVIGGVGIGINAASFLGNIYGQSSGWIF